MTTDKTGGMAALFRPHAAKRLSIIDAAASVFCREGFGGANIDLIAAEAGVSRQTVYNHHGDKETLFKAVVGDVTERTNAGFFATLATFPDHPRRSRSRPHRLRLPPQLQLRLQPRRQVPAPAAAERRRPLSGAVRGLARGRSRQDLGSTCRPLRAACPCRLSRHRRSRPRRAAVPGAGQRRPRTSPRCSAKRPTRRSCRRSAANAVRTFLRAYRRRPEPLTPSVREKSSAERLTIACTCPISVYVGPPLH